MSFKFDLELRRLSAIVAAINIWESPSVKKRTEEYFKKAEKQFFKFFLEEDDWSFIVYQVTLQADLSFLPETLRDEIACIIPFIGEQIRNWAEYVYCKLQLKSKYYQVYWTPIGTIDETKVFEFVWKENLPDPELKKDLLVAAKKNSLYSLACAFIDEWVIIRSFFNMRCIIETYFSLTHMEKQLNTKSVISIWLYFFFFHDAEKNYYATSNKLEFKIYPDDELLKMCANAGLERAVAYFANELKTDDDRYLIEAVCEVFNTYSDGVPQTYMTEKFLRVIMFLLNKMSNENKILLMTEYCEELLEMFLNTWPYEEFTLKLLCIVADGNSERKLHYCLLTILNKLFVLEHNSEYLYRRKFYQKVLQKLLEIVPKETKIKAITLHKNVLHSLFVNNELVTLSLILNDNDLVEIKDELIDLGRVHFRTLIEGGNFTHLNHFLKIVQLSAEEKTRFKYQFNCLKLFLKEKKFDLAEKLLVWLTDSDEERVKLKREVDTIEVFLSYYNEEKKLNLSIMDHVLLWQFDGESDLVKRVKTSLRSKELFLNEFCRIWAGGCYISLEITKRNCTKFLNWFYEPWEVDVYKREKLIENETFIEIFCDHLHLPENLNTLEELFKFCSVSNDKIKAIKQRIIDDIVRWINSYGIEKHNFRIVYLLLNWVLENENQKKEIIGKYLSSLKGAELYYQVVCNHSSSFMDPILIFLNLWVKPFGNIKILKENVAINFREKCYPEIKQILLDKLESGESIAPGDIKNFMDYSVKMIESSF